MQIIQANGADYVSTRDLEVEYKLTRKRCWQELQKISPLDFLTIARLRFYPTAQVLPHFETLKRK